jgi:hypothetical protein
MFLAQRSIALDRLLIGIDRKNAVGAAGEFDAVKAGLFRLDDRFFNRACVGQSVS